MSKTAGIAAMMLLALSLVAGAQKADPDAQKVAEQYAAAFNKGDAKALAALYTAGGARLGTDGQLVAGRAALEAMYAAGFAGPLKGSKLTLVPGSSHVVAPDVKVIAGRFTTDGIATVKGRYVNTIVKQGAHWLLASVVTIPDPPAMK
jgi:uncharacterized protein (TIGR02246 family)